MSGGIAARVHCWLFGHRYARGAVLSALWAAHECQVCGGFRLWRRDQL